MKKRILVTGGNGFLGASLVRRLVNDGYSVTILDNGFRCNMENLLDLTDHITFLKGDIRDYLAVKNAAKDIDSVIHLAAVNGTEFFYSKASLVLDVGVRGILNVIQACKELNIRELIVASSSEVYQTPSKIPSDETESLVIPDIMNPRYSYGGSKIITELLVINQCADSFERAIIFRPHNVYGPSMGWEHVIPQIIVRAANLIKQYPKGIIPFPIQGDGTQTRAFIHIDDMIEGICLLLNKGNHLNIYHIGNPEEISIKNLVLKIFNFLERDCEIIPGPLQKGSTERRCPNIDKIKHLGFDPKINLDQGLKDVINWYTNTAANKMELIK